MLILNVIVLILIAFGAGYAFGKEKIVVKRKMTPEQKLRHDKILREAEERIEKYNRGMENIFSGGAK